MCRSTQWVVSLNTALSPSSCVVIQEQECNHTLGSLTPLNLVPHPVSNPRSRSSSQVLVGLWHGLQSGRAATQTGLGPYTHRLRLYWNLGRTSIWIPSNRRLSGLERSCEQSVVVNILADTP